MRSTLKGFSYPMRAWSYLLHEPELRRLMLIPLLINIIVGGLLYAAMLTAGLRAIDRAVAELPSWAQSLEGLIAVLLIIGLLIVIGYLLGRFGVVFGSPFYGKLSEQLERRLTGQAPPAEPLNMVGILHELGRALSFELKKLLLVLICALPLLLLNFIPALGQLASLIGQICLGTLIACLDFLDPPLERRRLGFRAKLSAIRQMLPASASFGLICFGLVSIPFLNLLAIPLCITAGTLFFCEQSEARGQGSGIRV